MMDQTLKCQECGTVQAVTDRIFYYYTVSHRRPWNCSTECRAAALTKKRSGAPKTTMIRKTHDNNARNIIISSRKSNKGFLGVARRMIAAAAAAAESK